MKKIIVAGILLVNTAVFGQSSNHELGPEKMVEEFFEAFHQQDTVALRSFAYKDPGLQSVSIDSEGNTKVMTDTYSEFLNNIVSIPAKASFKEELHEYRIEHIGLLATVTTPYSFYYNGNFSHCGVNSFQLVKFNGAWKIVHLIDTRIKECS